jgi:BirA family transcriptional regulator, biotin operon repressor / biotin---[acetyl-CoA-carboxylase] ligase
VGPREFYEEIPSTQDRALALARAGAVEGTRVVARRQSRGRGRADHAWASPAGGLYLSVVLDAPTELPTLLPLGLGAALAERLRDATGATVRTKWPNDLLVVDGRGPARKLAGVLVDRVGDRAVAGIGMNVSAPAADLPPEVGARAISLSEIVSPTPSLEAVEALGVDAALETARALREPAGRDVVLARCRRLLYGVGRPARLDGRAVGRIAGLDPDGALRLEGPGGHRSVRAGDLTVEGAA